MDLYNPSILPFVNVAGVPVLGAIATYGPTGQRLEVNTAAGFGGFAANTWSATATEAPRFVFQRSKSATVGTHTVVASGDALGAVLWYGSDGTDFELAAGITVAVDAAPGNNDMPGRLMFSTTADGANALTERMRIDSSGRVLVNGTAAYGSSSRLEVNESANYGGFTANTWSTNATHAPIIQLNRSKSATIGTNTAVANNDSLGFVTWRGTDGSNLITAVQVRAEVDGVVGTNDMPGRLVFLTTADGAADVTERLRITNAGYFGFGTQATPDQMVEFAQTETITADANDGYAAALRLDPGYTAAAAKTITRHNYIEFQDVSVAGAGPAAVTNACLFALNAALGTHKATTNADVTGTAKSGTLKVNIAGTIFYLQLYAGA